LFLYLKHIGEELQYVKNIKTTTTKTIGSLVVVFIFKTYWRGTSTQTRNNSK